MASTLSHPAEAARFVADDERAHWHDRALWFVRPSATAWPRRCPNGKSCGMRVAIKQHTMSHLAGPAGAVRTQRDSDRGDRPLGRATPPSTTRSCSRILQRHKVTRVVKSKSMLTEECHLNPYLERHGIEVIDTDLGEWIVQLRDEPPSHIVLPAIHIKKEEVGELFHEHLGTEPGRPIRQYLDRSGPQAAAAEVPGGRGRNHGRQLRHRRDRRLRRLHERRERRSGDVAAPAAHRLHGHRKADSPGGRSGRVSAAAGPLGDRAADHDVHRRTSTARAPAASCTSCWSTTAAATFSAATTSAGR